MHNKQQVLDDIRKARLLPIIRTRSAEEAIKVAEALVDAKLTALELTLSVPGAVEIIGEMATRWRGKILVGAGTVLDAAAARACIDAGAAFVVTPATLLDVISQCKEAGIAVIPGALTPTEVLTASRAGADMVKVFPCGAMGGPSYLKFLRGPLPHIEYVPTGGVSLQNAAAYIKAGASVLGVGADLFDVDGPPEARPANIAQRARAYLDVVAEARRQ